MRLANFLPQALMPREERFFGLLRSSGRNMHETAQQLVELMEHYENIEEKTAEIKRLEEIGDHLIHEIMTNLHRTFVTPLEREDIALLGERLDDVVDDIEETARIMQEYRIPRPTERAKELAHLIERASAVLAEAIEKLHWRGSKLREILPHTVEVNRLENEADQVTSRAVGELFANDTDAIEIIKWKDIYEQLEKATDRCEDVANVLEGVVLKHA